MDKNLRDFFVSGILAPSRDVMLVKYSLVNEKMVMSYCQMFVGGNC